MQWLTSACLLPDALAKAGPVTVGFRLNIGSRPGALVFLSVKSAG